MTDQPISKMLRRVQLSDGQVLFRHLLFDGERLAGIRITKEVDYDEVQQAMRMPIVPLRVVCEQMGIEVKG